MAIYTKPDEVPRRKGSTGGSTFTRTCNGFIIRKRYKPKLSKTPRETVLRSRFGSASQHWRTLDSGDQNRYVIRHDLFEYQNSLGQTYVLQPAVLQNKFSIIKLSNSGTYQNICQEPFAVTVPAFTGGGANVNPPFLSIAYDMVTEVTDDNIALYMTRKGRYSLPLTDLTQLHFVEYRNLFQATTVDMLPAYIERFGSPNFQVGDEIVFYARNLSRFRSQFSEYTFQKLTFN